MESIGTKTKKLPTTEQNYDLLLGKDLSVANTGIMEAIAEHDSRPKWFIGMVCTKEFGIFIFSGGVSFTQMSLFQPDPYKNVRNPTQIVIYFDGRKSLTFL